VRIRVSSKPKLTRNDLETGFLMVFGLLDLNRNCLDDIGAHANYKLETFEELCQKSAILGYYKQVIGGSN
jgi:hypothetical protein